MEEGGVIIVDFSWIVVDEVDIVEEGRSIIVDFS